MTIASKHYPYVEAADPVGMLPMFVGSCVCGWQSDPTPEEPEAERAVRQHRFEHYRLTLDDFAWMAGTGRWAQ